jgi:MoxR-like ATPase
MSFPYFRGGPVAAPPEAPIELEVPDRSRQQDPAGYLADDDLADAVNVALVLGQPLLLTGEPGTGKTQLAHRLAWQLGYGRALVFNTKSTSVARDLFYTFDTLGRFHAAQTGEGSTDNLDYLTYNALGVAILCSHPIERVEQFLRRGSTHAGPTRSVVLIDEIDKAPRDFPNDLLHEIEQSSFRIPELANAEVVAAPEHRPIVVLTSNSEKNLPDAFLRRCVFFNIPFPDAPRLADIVRSRLGVFADRSPLLDTAIELFVELRGQNLRKPPSTAELINWLQALVRWGAEPARPVLDAREALRRSTSTLAKTQEDLAELDRFLAKRFNW